MPELNLTLPTYADFAKRLDPDDNIGPMIEMMRQTNPILMDAGIVEGNLSTGHLTTIRTGLPTATWRRYNAGVQPSKSTTRQVTETCGMLEAYAEVDLKLANLNNNAAAWRLSEDRAFLMAMNNEMMANLMYGNEGTSPEKFTGIAARYNSATAETYANVIKAGGAGADNTSMYWMTWGENTAHLIYPKGSKAGFMQEDLGQVTLTDASGGRFEGLRTHYSWDVGFVLRDWRYCGRIANIDVSDIRGMTGASYTGLINNMLDMYYRIQDYNMGTTIIYCTRTVAAALHKLAMNQTNVTLALSDWHGRKITSFLGIPIVICDGIIETETLVP